MNHLTNIPRCAALAAAFAFGPLAAPLLAQETGQSRAVVTIPAPRSANLLQLRGIGGRGTALIRIDGACHKMPVRLVAGDFAGRQPGLRSNGPIVLHIRNPEFAGALLNGADIVSDEKDVTDDPEETSADILILSGLTAETGFVINPGRSLLADIFGATVSQIPCDQTGAAKPAGK